MTNLSRGALADVKVLDLTRVLAGPFCTMMLADMGAEVIKIERPGKGDDTRQMGPFQNGESAYYMNLNRNKKGVTLNLKHPHGKKLFLELVAKADVVMENYRPGTMEKLGLGYDVLKKTNPGIVYASISGFGHYGPYKDRPGYDIIAQAMGGLMSTSGWPGGEPTRTGTAMGDVLAGLSAAIGILAALHNRTLTGQGQAVDVALVDSVVASLEIINMIYLVEKRLPQRIGNRYESTYPYDSFKAADGSLVIGTANDKLWHLLCKAMEQPDLCSRQEFLTVPDRVAHHAELKKIIEAWTMKYKVADIVDQLLNQGIPCAPIYGIDQVVHDPHIAGAREMFVEIEHPKAGPIKVTGSHIKLSETKPSVKTPSPLLGQDNKKIFAEWLGLEPAELSRLKEQGVL